LAGRTPRDAVQEFLEPLREVAGCITAEGFVARGFDPAGGPYVATFQSGVAVLDRRRGLPPVKLMLFHRYRLLESVGDRNPWRTSTTEWIYDIADQNDALIVAFHRHPGAGRIGWPHAHAHGAHELASLHKLHIPTGRLSLEAVVRFLIEDLDVVPRRTNWREILDRHEEAFRVRRTWH